MTDKLMVAVGISIILLILAGGCAIQRRVWNECRQEHSMFYCWSLVSR